MTTTTDAPAEVLEEERLFAEELASERIRPRGFRLTDALDIVGAAFGSFCLTWLVYERLTPLSGGLGFGVAWYVTFLATVWFLARERVGALQARDRLVGVVVATVGVGMLIPLALIVGYTIARGYHALRPQFFTQDQSQVGALSTSTEGGGSAAIVGSLEMVGIATLLSVPLGIATAVFLSEIKGRLARPVRMIVDAMSAIPSIVAGLFIYAGGHHRVAPTSDRLLGVAVARGADAADRDAHGRGRAAARARRLARGVARARWRRVGDRTPHHPPDRAHGLAHRGDPRHRARRR